MTDYTAKEIKDAIEAQELAQDEADYDDDDNYFEGWGEMGYSPITLTLRGERVTTVPVEDIGGEGQGDYAAVIFKVGTQTFRQEGYYASHYGSDYDGDFGEVEQYEKTVKDWRPVK